MKIKIKEYIGAEYSEASEKSSDQKVNIQESLSNKSKTEFKPGDIIQRIEGIHVGATGNATNFTLKALTGSIPSWTSPYNKPLILHHNDKNGIIIGRIINVFLEKYNTRSGTPALIFDCHVSNKEAIEQIIDGRLSTVSIGCTGTDVTCSVCGEPIEVGDDGEALCGHVKGDFYKGEMCTWLINEMIATELSYVIVPSDKYAHNLERYTPEEYQKLIKKEVSLTESQNNEGKDIKMKDVILKEGQPITTEIKDGETIVKTPEAKEEEKDVKTTETPETKADKVETPEEKVEEEKPAEKSEKEIELEEKIVSLEGKLEEANKLIAETKESLKALEGKLEKAEETLKVEVELKEAAENKMIDLNLVIRESLENELNSLRASLNKTEIDKVVLKERSESSIKDAIIDLKEELNSIKSLKITEQLANPTINQEKNKNKSKVNVKETNTSGNINVEEEVENIFSSLF